MNRPNRNNSGLLLAGLISAGALCAIPIAANAQQVIILPGYQVSQSAGADAAFAGNDANTIHTLGPVSDAHTSPVGSFGEGAASASGSVTGLPSPLMSASASGSTVAGSVPAGFETNIDNGAGYTGLFRYAFEVIGPTAAVSLQVKSLAQYATSGLTQGMRLDAFVQAAIDQTDGGGGFVAHLVDDTSTLDVSTENAVPFVSGSSDVTGNVATGFTGGFDDQGFYTFQTFTPYEVTLQLRIDAYVNGFGGAASISGSVDPTFSVAPGVADPGDYSFFFSDGVGNTPLTGGGVPEPATWAMMLLGFAGLGAALRGRRREASSIA